jgi:hypothetical protein
VGRGLYTPYGTASSRTDSGKLDLVVIVARVYGVHVLVRDEQGKPPRAEDSLRRSGCSLPHAVTGHLALDMPLVECLGLRASELRSTTRDDFVVLCLAGATEPGPLSLGVGIAGYES